MNFEWSVYLRRLVLVVMLTLCPASRFRQYPDCPIVETFTPKPDFQKKQGSREYRSSEQGASRLGLVTSTQPTFFCTVLSLSRHYEYFIFSAS